ncbi:MAG: GNAT family N-acetyltransferase [Bacillota bacterium]
MSINSLPKEIQTERLKLVPITEELYRNLYGSYEMGPHISLHLDDLKKDQRLLGWGAWIAFDKSGAPVGDMGFKGRPDKAGKVEIGYGVKEPHQELGYATEGVQGLIDRAFSFPEVREVTAECYENNLPSIRVLEKLGFERIAQAGDLIFWRLRDGY